MKKIILKNGDITLVDDVDYESLKKYVWKLSASGYAVRHIYSSATKTKKFSIKHIWMAREIMDAPVNKAVDHINRDKLDNRRCNLRVCSPQENWRNRKLSVNNKSGYNGVYWHKSRNKWSVTIKVNKKTKYLGQFIDKKDAARAYNEAAKKYFGEFAHLNIVD